MSMGDATPIRTASTASFTSIATIRSTMRAASPSARRERGGPGTIVVVAALTLAAEQPRIYEPPLGERRTVSRIEEESLEYTRRHGEVHVVADEVHQLEGAHPESAGLAKGPVDRRDVGDPFFEDAQRLAVERPRDAVDDETRRVRRHDRRLAPRAGQRGRLLHDRRRRRNRRN